MSTIKVTTDWGALLRSKATRTLVLLLVVLTPLTWFFYRCFRAADNRTVQVLFAVALAAPLLGLLVAGISYFVLLVRRRRVVLRIGEEIKIPGKGVTFALAELSALQLFSKDECNYLVLIPSQISERLTPGTAATGQHQLKDYTVKFPARPTIETFELADQILSVRPQVEVTKIGTV